MTSALLVVDVQNGIFASNNPPHLSEKVIENINQLVDYANASELLTVFIQHEIPGMLEPDSDAWQIFSGINVEHSDTKIRTKCIRCTRNREKNHLRPVFIRTRYS